LRPTRALPTACASSRASGTATPSRKRGASLQGAKQALKSIRQQGRLLTAHSRPLPDAIILGAQRSGTSSLLRYLAQHPEIERSKKKEVHYFDVNFERGERWYRSHFARRADRTRVVVEASPYYLVHPRVPERISRTLPDVKLVALLRDPVERALSHYFHETRKGHESLELMPALRAEEERLAGEVERMLEDDSYASHPHRRFSYKTRGLYAGQLRRFDAWRSSGRLIVIRSEDLFTNPASVLVDLFRFLGVDDEFRCSDLAPRNVGSNRAAVAPEAYAHLVDFFAPANEELEKLLGRRFHWQER
jgi:hypothetical protein